MDMEQQRFGTFLQELSSAAPTPGGGGASAYVGALGTALGAMVCNLTKGKKKYANVEDDITRLLQECLSVSNWLIQLIEADAAGFKPLAAAYSLPKDRPDYDEVMGKALVKACEAPLEIMRTALRGLRLQEELAAKGSRLAISDVGVGVQFLKAAINGASLNVYINARSMKDRSRAAAVIAETERLEQEGNELADRIYAAVREGLR